MRWTMVWRNNEMDYGLKEKWDGLWSEGKWMKLWQKQRWCWLMMSWWNLKLITEERDDQNPNLQSIFSLGRQWCWSSKAICLTPANLLTMKSKVILPPSGCYSSADIYSRKRWRRVQHIANEFWSRWRKEFLQAFQERKTCKTRRTNSRNGDIVP